MASIITHTFRWGSWGTERYCYSVTKLVNTCLYLTSICSLVKGGTANPLSKCSVMIRPDCKYREPSWELGTTRLSFPSACDYYWIHLSFKQLKSFPKPLMKPVNTAPPHAQGSLASGLLNVPSWAHRVHHTLRVSRESYFTLRHLLTLKVIRWNSHNSALPTSWPPFTTTGNSVVLEVLFQWNDELPYWQWKSIGRSPHHRIKSPPWTSSYWWCLPARQFSLATTLVSFIH